MDVEYRVVYAYDDGTRSPPSTLTARLYGGSYCAPFLYIEFGASIASLMQSVGSSGKRRTALWLQRTGSVACGGSSTSSWEGLAIDVVRLDAISGNDYCNALSNNGVKCLD
jgi:hypothetical protein